MGAQPTQAQNEHKPGKYSHLNRVSAVKTKKGDQNKIKKIKNESQNHRNELHCLQRP
jgi:hypothetical protein